MLPGAIVLPGCNIYQNRREISADFFKIYEQTSDLSIGKMSFF